MVHASHRKKRKKKKLFFFHSRIIPGPKTDALNKGDGVLQQQQQQQQRGGGAKNGKYSYLCTYWHKYRRIYI